MAYSVDAQPYFYPPAVCVGDVQPSVYTANENDKRDWENWVIAHFCIALSRLEQHDVWMRPISPVFETAPDGELLVDRGAEFERRPIEVVQYPTHCYAEGFLPFMKRTKLDRRVAYPPDTIVACLVSGRFSDVSCQNISRALTELKPPYDMYVLHQKEVGYGVWRVHPDYVSLGIVNEDELLWTLS